jgi:hypothetical protein
LLGFGAALAQVRKRLLQRGDLAEPGTTKAEESAPPVPATLPARAPMVGRDGKPMLDAGGQPIIVDAVPPDTMINDAGARRKVVGPGGSVGEEIILAR